ncbi:MULTISPECIES: LysR family transcriptional regulator [unclassified Bacillus (in: firmicutes)]|uniref:LysR family transcriptional regulator n=1 Tax=unclassified Bacillus (in: firmicutes) TaxID=185979 RepID=UPI0004E20211|nr:MULTISPECIES: LysR family transcriptional regulator [unclassified Bacillus (in: firmicutes)]CAI9394727.1 HTH-type transcriptional regulator GltR [Bacillus sp. T2.9-1]
MDLNSLDSFITIVREKSITKASHMLHITQPALTSKLKKLETEVGVQLVERSKKGVELTIPGTSFLVKALKMVREFDSGNILDQDGDFFHSTNLNKNLKIGITRPLATSLLPDILSSINEFDPNLKCNITSELTDLVLDLVLFGELHFGIVCYCKPQEELEFIPIYKDDIVLIGPKSDSNPLDKKKLVNKPFILFNKSLPLRHDANEILLNMLGEIPENIQEVNDTYALISMISSGLGYSFLPLSFILDFVQLRNFNKTDSYDMLPFKITNLGKYSPPRYIHIVYAKNRSTNLPIERLAEYIKSSRDRQKNMYIS